MLFYVIAIIVAYLIGYYVGSYRRGIKFKDMALKIAQREGKKKSVNIAQINEILKITLEELGIK